MYLCKLYEAGTSFLRWCLLNYPGDASKLCLDFKQSEEVIYLFFCLTSAYLLIHSTDWCPTLCQHHNKLHCQGACNSAAKTDMEQVMKSVMNVLKENEKGI